MSSNTKSTPKASRKSRLVTLHLSPTSLAKFPTDVPSKPASSAPPTAIKVEAKPSIAAPTPVKDDKSSESNATPIPTTTADTPDPNSLAPPAKIDGRRKRGGGAVAGRKRAPPTIDPNAPPRERGRPGPKKKPRLPDGTIDRSADPSKPATAPGALAPIPAHKLGPKANTGAINAGLRALDRSGKPCRRWEKKGLQLKSFTGATWNMSSWKAPSKMSGLNEDGETKSDSSSENVGREGVGGSSAVGSERSHSGGVVDGDGDGDVSMSGLASSPAPVGAAT